MGASLVLVGSITFGGEHPHINKQGFLNPGQHYKGCLEGAPLLELELQQCTMIFRCTAREKAFKRGRTRDPLRELGSRNTQWTRGRPELVLSLKHGALHFVRGLSRVSLKQLGVLWHCFTSFRGLEREREKETDG